ncbi:hypothetical protein NA78x_002153 [Anatilimnocola sp. NA78]|uniref:hypothetical protein n=1 Tax=Anatilimnocola sp. NA78 TaxID=3415683 RepID=UPI003CE4CB74
MLNWQRGGWSCVLCVALCGPTSYAFAQREAPGGDASALRAQLEKLQSQLRTIERADEARGKVTEIGSSRGRLRDEEEARLVVKVYDLSDLFTVAPSYPAYEPNELQRGELLPVFPHVGESAAQSGGFGGGGFGGGGGGMFSVPEVAPKPATIDRSRPSTLNQASGMSGAPAANVRTSMDSLISTLTSTIDPEGWSDVGGRSTISAVGTSLLISTTTETHAKITGLIDLFRSRWGSLRTISLQANWLWLTPSQLNEAAALPAPDDKTGQAASKVSLHSIKAEAWKKLLAAAAEKPGVGSGYHSVVTCYNGQTVATQAGTQRLVVAGMEPVVGGGETLPAYRPTMRAVHEGATLQITPLATRNVKYVALDVHSRVSLLASTPRVLEKVEKVDVEKMGVVPREVVQALDRPVLQTQRLETTLRVPVGQPTLIGGMTFASATGDSAHLYLFITAHVQELRDDDPAVTTPALAPPAIVPDADLKPTLNK